MQYQVREIRVPLTVNELFSFEALPLCEILEGRVEISSSVWNGRIDTSESLYIVVLERWGQKYGDLVKHNLILLEPGFMFCHTVNYEPILSHKGAVRVNDRTFYLFQVS